MSGTWCTWWQCERGLDVKTPGPERCTWGTKLQGSGCYHTWWHKFSTAAPSFRCICSLQGCFWASWAKVLKGPSPFFEPYKSGTVKGTIAILTNTIVSTIWKREMRRKKMRDEMVWCSQSPNAPAWTTPLLKFQLLSTNLSTFQYILLNRLCSNLFGSMNWVKEPRSGGKYGWQNVLLVRTSITKRATTSKPATLRCCRGLNIVD